MSSCDVSNCVVSSCRVLSCAVSSCGRLKLCGVELWPYRAVPCRVLSCRNDGLPIKLQDAFFVLCYTRSIGVFTCSFCFCDSTFRSDKMTSLARNAFTRRPPSIKILKLTSSLRDKVIRSFFVFCYMRIFGVLYCSL